MKIHKMFNFSFTEQEMVEMMKCHIEFLQNDEVPGTPKYEEYGEIVDLIRTNKTMTDFSNERYVLIVDGNIEVEVG